MIYTCAPDRCQIGLNQAKCRLCGSGTTLYGFGQTVHPQVLLRKPYSVYSCTGAWITVPIFPSSIRCRGLEAVCPTKTLVNSISCWSNLIFVGSIIMPLASLLARRPIYWWSIDVSAGCRAASNVFLLKSRWLVGSWIHLNALAICWRGCVPTTWSSYGSSLGTPAQAQVFGAETLHLRIPFPVAKSQFFGMKNIVKPCDSQI